MKNDKMNVMLGGVRFQVSKRKLDEQKIGVERILKKSPRKKRK